MAQSTLRETLVISLTPSNVIPVVRKVKNWWGYGSLACWLYIPDLKQEEIRARFPDEEEQKKEAISYWINTDPLASWRRLITALDEIEETELADSIRSNAEPYTDKSYCLQTLLMSVSSVKDFWRLLWALDVPKSVRVKIRNDGSSEEKKRESGLLYYLQNLAFYLTWGRIARVLWYMEEYTALEFVKKHLPATHHDQSFTQSNLTLALETFPAYEWKIFGEYTNVPVSAVNKIDSQFSSDEDKMADIIRILTTQHPYPTWQLISDVLYRILYHNVLEKINILFPTGN